MKICLNGALLAAMVVSTTHAEQCSDWSWSHCPTNRGCSKQGKGKNKSCVGTLATNAPIPSPTQPPATTCNDIEEEADCLGATFGTEQCHWQGSGNNKHCDVYHAPAANSCAGFDEEIDCVTSDLNCVYKSSGNPSQRCQPYDPNEACSVRATKESECEIDDKCMLKKGGGSTACVEVPVGTGTTNATCAVKLIQDPDGDYYEEDATNGCDGTNTCVVIDASGFFDYNTPVPGKCQSTECVGKKVPGNCNGNTQNKDQCESQTSRVTICHRTCSRKNPWVRITIDEDAWDGQGCGHQQHDVRDECKNKAPWAEWGINRKDYLLKAHGTRDDVAVGRNAQEIRAYWRQWERACPYVRNGACCEWNNPNNPCCGEAPPANGYPDPTPAIDIKKYAGPSGMCSEEMFASSGFVDENYALPSGSANWQYCYKITVPETDDGECLYDVKMSDAAPLGGTADGALISVTPDLGGIPPAVDAESSTLCPGAVKYIVGKSVKGLAEPELDYDAYVIGTGIDSGNDATDTDPAGVIPKYTPDIKITKYAGPLTGCPATGIPNTPPMADLLYSADPLTREFKYCYFVENIGNECILAAQMDDTANGGIGTKDIEGAEPTLLCPGESVTISGPDSLTEGEEPCVNATAMGTGQFSGTPVSSSDAACVKVEWKPEISIEKYAGPHGACPASGPGASMDPVLYTAGADKAFMYCYTIKNTGNECLYLAQMTDSANPGGSTESISGNSATGDNLFCPNDEITVAGPETTFVSPEECVNADAMGTGQFTGTVVTATDGACVQVPDCSGDMSTPGNEWCPMDNGVVLAHVMGADEQALTSDPLGIIYNLDTVDGGASLKFKVDNPYAEDMDMYVQYHKPTGGGGGWSEACYAHETGGCASMTEAIQADCLKGDGHPYTLVQVYFVDSSATPAFLGGATVDKCCVEGDPVPDTAAVAQYTFLVRCECPAASRRLGEKAEPMDVEKVLALFAH